MRLTSLVLLLAATHDVSAAQLEGYAVPSVDYAQPSSATQATALLRALQGDGIVALKNVPKYSELREQYLAKAAACVVTAKANGAEFLLHRKLDDGTQRYTISTESGRRLSESGEETLEHCPGYLEVYQSFSSVVEEAVANVGTALDSTTAFKVTTLAATARKLMEESVHLDHFHAYEAPPDAGRTLSSEDDASDLSLAMHTDNGLMIAMSAPEYFDVEASGQVNAKQTRSEDAGLIIETAAGERVRALLQADELVLMMGQGINQWIQTTPPLRPVLHGMRYPKGLSYADASTAEEHTLLRAWFGKMVLLGADDVMENTGMTYGQYANQTTRYLIESGEDNGAFAAVACPPRHRLLASDTSCSTKICSAKSGADTSALTYSCQVTCNHESTDDAALCTKYCDCEDATVSGHACWMLCVADLSSSSCSGTQACNNAYTLDTLAMTCSSNSSSTTTTPTPTTKTPTTTTPATTTKTPTTTTPATSSPATTEAASATSSSSESDEDVGASSEPSDASSLAVSEASAGWVDSVSASASTAATSSDEDTELQVQSITDSGSSDETSTISSQSGSAQEASSSTEGSSTSATSGGVSAMELHKWMAQVMIALVVLAAL